jgi:hypothetical protein
VQPDVVEEQIEVEGLLPNRERDLAADEGEAAAPIDQ